MKPLYSLSREKILFKDYSDSTNTWNPLIDAKSKEILDVMKTKKDIHTLRYIWKNHRSSIDSSRRSMYSSASTMLDIHMQELFWSWSSLQEIKEFFDSLWDGDDAMYIASRWYETKNFSIEDRSILFNAHVSLCKSLSVVKKNIIWYIENNDIETTDPIYKYLRLQLDYIDILSSPTRFDDKNTLTIYMYLDLFLQNKRILPHSSLMFANSQLYTNGNNKQKEVHLAMNHIPKAFDHREVADSVLWSEKRIELKNTIQNVLSDALSKDSFLTRLFVKKIKRDQYIRDKKEDGYSSISLMDVLL